VKGYYKLIPFEGIEYLTIDIGIMGNPYSKGGAAYITPHPV
jgi:hypothetical protein